MVEIKAVEKIIENVETSTQIENNIEAPTTTNNNSVNTQIEANSQKDNQNS